MIKENAAQAGLLPGWVLRDRQSALKDAASLRLARAAVNAGNILPPATRDPRDQMDAGSNSPFSEDEFANAPGSPIGRPAFTADPDQPRFNLSLQSLTQFSWAGTLADSAHSLNRLHLPKLCPDHLLICLEAGSLRLGFPRFEQLLRANSITFIPAGTAFFLKHIGTVHGDVLTIPASLPRRTGTVLPSDILSGCPDGTDAAEIMNCFSKLGKMPGSLGPANLPLIAVQLNRLALALPRYMQVITVPALSFDHSCPARHIVRRFLRLVRRDIGYNLTIADLAQDLQVSTIQLERACHDQRGRSPLDLIHDLRLEYAISMLRTGHHAADIARQAGYVGLPHMKRAFIAATGRKPEDFTETPLQFSS